MSFAFDPSDTMWYTHIDSNGASDFGYQFYCIIFWWVITLLLDRTRYQPTFAEKQVKMAEQDRKGFVARNLGTFLHTQIGKLLLGETIEKELALTEDTHTMVFIALLKNWLLSRFCDATSLRPYQNWVDGWWWRALAGWYFGLLWRRKMALSPQMIGSVPRTYGTREYGNIFIPINCTCISRVRCPAALSRYLHPRQPFSKTFIGICLQGKNHKIEESYVLVVLSPFPPSTRWMYPF